MIIIRVIKNKTICWKRIGKSELREMVTHGRVMYGDTEAGVEIHYTISDIPQRDKM